MIHAFLILATFLAAGLNAYTRDPFAPPTVDLLEHNTYGVGFRQSQLIAWEWVEDSDGNRLLWPRDYQLPAHTITQWDGEYLWLEHPATKKATVVRSRGGMIQSQSKFDIEMEGRNKAYRRGVVKSQGGIWRAKNR